MAFRLGFRRSMTTRCASRTSIGLSSPLRTSAASSLAVFRQRSVMRTSFAGIDDGDDRTAALRPLVHGIDRHEDCRIADRCRRDAADRTLRVAMMMNVGVIQHDLPAPAHPAPAAGPPFPEPI